MSFPEVRVAILLRRAILRDCPLRRRWLGLVLIGALLTVVPGAPAHAATPQDGYWSKDGLVKGEFPAIVFFHVRGGGTRIEQLGGYFGPPQPIVGACSRTLTDAGPVAVAPDGSFSYVNPNLTLSGRFTASNRAEGTYSYTDACDRVRRGPFPFFVDLRRAEAPERYRVELKAWIPHHDVVDPLRPVSTGYLAFKASPDEGCTHPPARHWLNAVVSSRYRGDDHLDYPGSARARVWVEFDWDGERITNLVHREQYDTTHRDLLYEWNRGLTGRTSRWCNVQSTTQTEDTTGVQRSERSFALGISSKNPLTPEAVTPPISSDLVGTFTADGKLDLAFDTDLFPSHGFTVTRNGRLQLTDVVADVSCLPKHKVIGLTGIETVSAGLIQKVQEGSVRVNPDDAGRRLVAKSKLCELSVDVHQVPGTPSSRGSARASARSTAVALLDRNGRPGRFVTLAIAARFGLVQAVTHGNGLLVLSDPARPIALRLAGRRLLVEMRRVRGGQVHSQAAFGPVSGTLETRMGTRLAARRNGRQLRGRRPDRKAPRTRAVVRVRGGVAKVRFRARDRSGVRRTRVVVGRRLVRLRRGVLRVPARRLSRVRFASVDVLGNAERWREIRRHRR